MGTKPQSIQISQYPLYCGMISSEPKTEDFTWNRLLAEEVRGEEAELPSSLHNADSTRVLPKRHERLSSKLYMT